MTTPDDVILRAPAANPRQPELTFQDPRRTAVGSSPGFESVLDQIDADDRQELVRETPTNPRQREDPGFWGVLDRIDHDQTEQDRAIAGALSQMAEVDPELAGEADRLGLELGVSGRLIEEDLPRYRRLWHQRQLRALAMTGGNPLTMRAFLDPEFARIAADDVDNLSMIEEWGAQWRAGRLEEQRALLWNQLREERLSDRERLRIRGRIDTLTEELQRLPTMQSTGLIGGAARTLAGMVDSLQESFAGGLAMATAVGLAGGSQGPQAPVALPTAFGVGFFTAMGRSSAKREAGNAYGEMMSMGVDPQEAHFWSGIVGGVNGILESVGGTAVSAPFRREATRQLSRQVVQNLLTSPTTRDAGLQAAKAYLQGLGGEVATEVAQEVSNIIGEEAAIARSDLTQLDLRGRPEAMDRLADITAASIKGMALLALPGPALQFQADVARARKAELDARALETFARRVEGSRTMPRSSRQMRSFLQQVVGDTDADTLYVSLEEFEARMREADLQMDDLEEFAPRMAERVREAAETGTIEIPTSDYGAKFLAQPFGKSLLPHLRVDPNGISQAELEQIDPALVQEQAQQAAEILDQDERARGEVRAIRRAFERQVTEAGRRRPEAQAAATIYGNFVAVQAARAGLSPRAFHEQFGLRVTADEAAGEALSQIQPPDTPEFRAFIDGSVVQEPVFHGTPNASLQEFDSGRAGENTQGDPEARTGFHFTDNPEVAATYSRSFEVEGAERFRQITGRLPNRDLPSEPGIIPAFVSLRNPLDVGASRNITPKLIREAKEAGHDGLVADLGNGREFVVFEPTQIKSATGNRGTFDPNDPSILRQADFGRYFPDARTAFLSKDANPSTIFHEMSHWFLFAMTDMVDQGIASAEVRADMDALLLWFKIDGEGSDARFQTWQAMSLEEQEKHHEAMARTFELYLMEGQAPNVGLRRVFHRIRSWMLNVYRGLRREVNALYRQQFGEDLPGMTSEVRQVFDRMVAADDAVADAEAVRAMRPMFETQEEFLEAGYTEAEWERYTRTLEDSHEQAVTKATTASLRDMQWLRNARSRHLREAQKRNDQRRAEMDEAVRSEVEQEGIYQAELYLRTAEAAGKLNHDAVSALLPDVSRDAALEKLGAGKRGRGTMLAKSGADPEIVADQLGFPDARTLIDDLVAARPLEEEVQVRSDRRMLETYGDILTPESMEREVDRALHNEARGRFLQTELKLLEGSTRNSRVMLAAAKEAARRAIDKRAVREIRPDRLAQSEARSAREALRLLARGDRIGAIRAKRSQLLYNQMVVEARRANEEVDRARSRFSKLQRTDKRLESMGNVSILQAARWVLAQYGLTTERQAEDASNFLRVLERADPGLFEVLEPELAKAQEAGVRLRRDATRLEVWRDLSMEEFRGVAEAVDTLVHRARIEKRISVDGRSMEVDTAVGELREQMPLVPEEVLGERGALTNRERRALQWATTRSQLVKIEHYLRALDGGVTDGPFQRYLFTGVRESVDSYRADAARHMTVLRDAIADLRKNGLLPHGKLTVPELAGYEFGRGTKGNGMIELLGALLHTGNLSNKKKFLLAGRGRGHPWATVNEAGEADFSVWDNVVQRLVDDGVLKPEHFDFVQGVWDMLERIKPTLQDAHIAMRGYPFREVRAQPFTVAFPDGTTREYAGGYVPATPDRDLMPSLNREVTAEELKREFLNDVPKANDGFTKTRVENYHERPLSMDLNRIAAHIDETLRYAHVQPRVEDALRVLNNREFLGDMQRLDPDFRDELMIPFLERSVRQSVYKRSSVPWVDSMLRYLRRSVGLVIMAGNVVNALQQITGLSNSLNYVSAKHMKNALYHYVTGRRGMMDEIVASSQFMDDRMNNQVLNLTNEMRGMLVDPTFVDRLEDASLRYGYILQSTMQNQVDAITWWGAYQQAQEQNKAHEDSVREADSAVRLAQGSFNPADLANYEVGTAAWRAVTQFTSYFNTMFNQIRFADNRVRTFILSATLPMIAAEAIAMTLWGQWDDEDEDGHFDTVFGLLAGSQLKGVASAYFPVVGTAAVNAIEAQFTGREFGDRVVASPTATTATRALASIIGLGKTLSEDEMSARQVRDVMTAIALLPGVKILAPAIRPISYLRGVETDQIDPTGGVDFVRGLITGRASEASR